MSNKSMTASKLEEMLRELIEAAMNKDLDALEELSETFSSEMRSVDTFENEGVLCGNPGLVIRTQFKAIGGRREFQLQICG